MYMYTYAHINNKQSILTIQNGAGASAGLLQDARQEGLAFCFAKILYSRLTDLTIRMEIGIARKEKYNI